MITAKREKIMIDSHPGGIELTKRLFLLAEPYMLPKVSDRQKQELTRELTILDLGAGNGESVQYLQEIGCQVRGIDLDCRGNKKLLEEMDMRKLSYKKESFDICLAECSLSGCGEGSLALKEAGRVLKPGGFLLVSDIFFQKEEAPSLSMKKPLTEKNWCEAFETAGFEVLNWKDETPLWREFFLESLWNGNADEDCIEKFLEYGKAKCGYFLAVLRKGEAHGFI